MTRFLLLLAICFLPMRQSFGQRKNLPDTIPADFESGHIVVDLKVNGHVRKFILDTGAPLGFSEKLVNELGIATEGSANVSDYNNASSSLKVSEVITDLWLGNSRMDYSRALVIPLGNSPFDCLGIDGFIGGKLFKRYSLKFDKKNGYVILEHKGKVLRPENIEGTKVRINKFWKPFLRISPFEKLSENVLFDTGDPALYSPCENMLDQVLAQRDVKSQILEESEGAANYGLFGLAKSSGLHYLELGRLRIDGTEIKGYRNNTHASGHSKLGSGLLDYGTVTLDYRRKRFYFEPYDNNRELEAKNRRLGAYYNLRGDKMTVSLVWKASPIYRQGVRRGFELISFDGEDLRKMDYCQKFELIKRSRDGKAHKLVFLDLEKNRVPVSLNPDMGGVGQ
ncbi:hypothetical protein FUAX_44840 (plasmid) [Fulvitalea axinellae]|uniref:Aspartyl protease n=1 Tax=Fulvitalea axinellae TaxID=1182444 RepID=A0AAU9D3A0_9BACT|nr:hypothetical protein FUAX_44840 [Fulvitalea axinellae]